MKEKFIENKQGKVYYWISDTWDKNKKTMFFLHGLTADHTMFWYQYRHYEKDYNIITWDAPAHGKSRPYSNFSYEDAAHTLKKILDKQQVTSVIMVGQSMGGFLTQAFLKRYPAFAEAFIAIDTTPYGEQYYSKMDKWWLRQVEWMAYCYPVKLMKDAIAKQVSVTKEGYENMLSMLAAYDKRELCHLMGIGYAGFLEDNANIKIECPTLLLLGEKDRTGTVKKYNHMWAKETGFPLIIISKAAHNSNVDNYEMVNAEIDKFLAKEIYSDKMKNEYKK